MSKAFDDVGLRQWSVKQAIQASYATEDLDVVGEANRIYEFLTELVTFEGPPQTQTKPEYDYWVTGLLALRYRAPKGSSPDTIAEVEVKDQGDWEPSPSGMTVRKLNKDWARE